jgi:hypothetical protein
MLLASFAPILAVNPVIASLGQVAAIIILLFVFVFVVIAVAFNLAMAFGLAWVREKAELFKLLRPSVDSINKTSESAIQGTPPAASENAIVRTVAQVPAQVSAADKKVVQVSDTVAEKVIEYRARTMQAKAIVSTFFAPKKAVPALPEAGIKSPGYRMLIEQQGTEGLKKLSAQNGRIAEQQGTVNPQAKDVTHR